MMGDRVREHFRSGGSVYVQSPETSVMRTMPLAIINDGCHSVVSDPESIVNFARKIFSSVVGNG